MVTVIKFNHQSHLLDVRYSNDTRLVPLTSSQVLSAHVAQHSCTSVFVLKDAHLYDIIIQRPLKIKAPAAHGSLPLPALFQTQRCSLSQSQSARLV